MKCLCGNGHVSPALAPGYFGRDLTSLWGAVLDIAVVCSIPGLHAQRAGSKPTTPTRRDEKCLQTLPNAPWGTT